MDGYIINKEKIFNSLILLPAFMLLTGSLAKVMSFDNSVSETGIYVSLFFKPEKTLSVILTVLLITSELILSTFLILFNKFLLPYLITAMLFIIFIFFNILKLISQGNVDCGCFGELINTNVNTIIMLDILMLGIILIKINNFTRVVNV